MPGERAQTHDHAHLRQRAEFLGGQVRQAIVTFDGQPLVGWWCAAIDRVTNRSSGSTPSHRSTTSAGTQNPAFVEHGNGPPNRATREDAASAGYRHELPARVRQTTRAHRPIANPGDRPRPIVSAQHSAPADERLPLRATRRDADRACMKTQHLEIRSRRAALSARRLRRSAASPHRAGRRNAQDLR